MHGEAGLAAARRATEIFFGAEIASLTDAQLGQIFADVPSKQLPRRRSAAGCRLSTPVRSGLAKSKGEARRTVAQGGAYVNNRRVDDVERKLTAADLASETVMVLRSGKKKYALLRFRVMALASCDSTPCRRASRRRPAHLAWPASTAVQPARLVPEFVTCRGRRPVGRRRAIRACCDRPHRRRRRRQGGGGDGGGARAALGAEMLAAKSVTGWVNVPG